MNQMGREPYKQVSSFNEFMEIYAPSSLAGARFKKMFEAQNLSSLNLTCLADTTTVLLRRGLMAHHRAAASAFVAYRHHIRKKERPNAPIS